MIKHDMRAGETIDIGGAKVTLKYKSGQRVTLLIDAPQEVVIKREPKPHELKEDTALDNSSIAV